MTLPKNPSGAQIKAETGKANYLDAAKVVRLKAPPFLQSDFSGKSKEVPLTWGPSDNFNNQDLINWLVGLGDTPAVININSYLISATTGKPCLLFPSSLKNAYIKLVIPGGGMVLGRGGAGSGDSWWNDGTKNPERRGWPGGNAIENHIGKRLQIQNGGTIGGGGGGGGQLPASSSKSPTYQGGGGGVPWGAAGVSSNNGKNSYHSGTAASRTAPGQGGGGGALGDQRGGNGGGLGQPGVHATGRTRDHGSTNGGPAGAAVVGDAPNWLATGTIHGAWAR